MGVARASWGRQFERMRDELRRALDGLQDAARSGADVGPWLERLDALRTAGDWEPKLRHFLENRSYEKARLHLEAQPVPPGACGR
jgi:hypothetical protein